MMVSALKRRVWDDQRVRMLLLLAALLPFLGACRFGLGPTVTIPNAYLGIVVTESGPADKVLQPSTIRLEGNCLICDEMLLVEAADYATLESMDLYMPQDDLVLTVEVRGRFAVTEGGVRQVFDRVPSERRRNEEGKHIDPPHIRAVTMANVYEIYARPVIRDAVRSYLANFTIEDVMSQREAIGANLRQEVANRLQATPVEVQDFGLAKVLPPSLIIEANEIAKQREVDIQRAIAQKQVDIEEAEARLEVARKQQEIDLVEAQTQFEVQQVLNRSVSPQFVTQRYLKFLEAMAASDNTVFVPIEFLQGDNEGVQFRIFSQELLTTLNQALSAKE